MGEAARIREEGKEKQNQRQSTEGSEAARRKQGARSRKGGRGIGEEMGWGDDLASVFYDGGNGDQRGSPTRGRSPGASRLGLAEVLILIGKKLV